MTTKNIVLPVGTEVKASEIGYYDFWYPAKLTHILCEEIHAETVSLSEGKLSQSGGWTPVMVSVYHAKSYGSPIRILWIRNKNKNS